MMQAANHATIKKKTLLMMSILASQFCSTVLALPLPHHTNSDNSSNDNADNLSAVDEALKIHNCLTTGIDCLDDATQKQVNQIAASILDDIEKAGDFSSEAIDFKNALVYGVDTRKEQTYKDKKAAIDEKDSQNHTAYLEKLKADGLIDLDALKHQEDHHPGSSDLVGPTVVIVDPHGGSNEKRDATSGSAGVIKRGDTGKLEKRRFFSTIAGAAVGGLAAGTVYNAWQNQRDRQRMDQKENDRLRQEVAQLKSDKERQYDASRGYPHDGQRSGYESGRYDSHDGYIHYKRDLGMIKRQPNNPPGPPVAPPPAYPGIPPATPQPVAPPPVHQGAPVPPPTHQAAPVGQAHAPAPGTPHPVSHTQVEAEPTPKKGMSTGGKVALGAGVVGAGALLYNMFSGSKSSTPPAPPPQPASQPAPAPQVSSPAPAPVAAPAPYPVYASDPSLAYQPAPVQPIQYQPMPTPDQLYQPSPQLQQYQPVTPYSPYVPYPDPQSQYQPPPQPMPMPVPQQYSADPNANNNNNNNNVDPNAVNPYPNGNPYPNRPGRTVINTNGVTINQ